MRDFNKLDVWKRSHQLALAAYKATADFPRDELYGLTSQIRRAAASVPANIAEGCGRDSDTDFARFLHFGMGSASELEYHLLLARDLGLMTAEGHRALSDQTTEVKKMLAGLLRSLKAEARRLIAES
jgi:four helix bundle protein